MTGPNPLTLQVFSGTVSFTPEGVFLVQGGNRAILLLDNSPTGQPTDAAVAGARTHFADEGLTEGRPLTVVGFVGSWGELPAIHVVRA